MFPELKVFSIKKGFTRIPDPHIKNKCFPRKNVISRKVMFIGKTQFSKKSEFFRKTEFFSIMTKLIQRQSFFT